MNILVVAHYQNDGSPTAIFIHDQILAYQKLGHSVRVVVPIAFGKLNLHGRRLETGVHQEDIDGIPHYFIRYLSLSKYGETYFNSAAAIHVLRTGLKCILTGFVPDVIHAHTLGFDCDIGAWLKTQLHVPLVVTTHGSDTFIPFRNHQFSRLKKTADHADRIVAVSSLLKKRLIEVGVQTSISVILNGFELRYVNDNVRPPVSLIQVGSLIERKKVDVTLHAFQHLQQKYPDATLQIVGSGPELSKLGKLCQTLNTRNSVHFLGQLSNKDVFTEMSKSRFFVMPSVREGFGIVYLEAMACGCITIGTDGEGIADLIVSGENGFLVPPNDPDAIVQAVEWCLTHPEETEAVVEQGRRDALGLTWEKNATQYMNLFRELIS